MLGIVLAASLLTPAGAQAAKPRALLLSSTVSSDTATDGSSLSLEQQQAQAAGFAVTVVGDSVWDAMSAKQFAQYRVVILGDPTCSSTVAPGSAAYQDMSTWEPVVMRSGGVRVLIGTDPTYHYHLRRGAEGLSARARRDQARRLAAGDDRRVSRSELHV